MKTATDHSYGIIPLVQKDSVWKVLLIEQIGRRGDTFWTLPKGHAEGAETPHAAATRELAEETGVIKVAVQTTPVFATAYSFAHQGVHIEKRVEYFIGLCESTTTKITQPDEVAQLRWCTFAAALALLPHTNTQQLLREVIAYLDVTDQADAQ